MILAKLMPEGVLSSPPEGDGTPGDITIQVNLKSCLLGSQATYGMKHPSSVVLRK